MRAGTLHVDGGTLETAWWGPGPVEAPTIVLLHEGLGSVALWRDVPERLAAATGWGVFAYSRFGYGASDPVRLPRPMTYMHEEAQTVLPAVLQAAGIQHAALLGHSDGGSIAAIYAGSRSPASTRAASQSIIAHASPAPNGDGGPSTRVPEGNPPDTDASGGGEPTMIRRTPGDHSPDRPAANPVELLGLIMIAAHFFVEDLNIASIRQIRTEYETGTLRSRLARYHRDVDTAFRGWNDAWLDPRFRDFDITRFLPAIRVPILALQGAADPYGTDAQLRVLEANVRAPIRTELIAAARHAPHLEAKEQTLAAIIRFIADLPRNPSP